MNEPKEKKVMQAKTASPRKEPRVVSNKMYLDNRMKGDFKFSINDPKTWLLGFAAMFLVVVGIWGVYLILPTLIGMVVLGLLFYEPRKQGPATVDNDLVIYNQTAAVAYGPLKNASENLQARQPVSVQDTTLAPWKTSFNDYHLMRFRLKKKSSTELEDETIAFTKACLQQDLVDSLTRFGFQTCWNGMPILMVDDIISMGESYLITLGYVNNPGVYRHFINKNSLETTAPMLQVKDKDF